MLEECGLDYAAHPIDISKDEQFKPDFLKISPNNRIPAIIDRDNGRSLFESGAILLYLADKTGKFIPKDPDGYWLAMQWLMWQMGGVGPMIGQVHHFLRNAKGKAPYAEERYIKEAHRLYGVLDKRLGEAEYLAGAYSIADMATWPWISRFEWHQVDIAKYRNVLRWYKAIAARPAVVKGYHVPVSSRASPCQLETIPNSATDLARLTCPGPNFSGVIAPVLTRSARTAGPMASASSSTANG
jgi:GST-like protein